MKTSVPALAILLCVTCALFAEKAKPDVPTFLEKRTFTDTVGHTLQYRLLRPETIEPGKKYPLVLFLHGKGECGGDNTKQLIHGVPEFAKPENRKAYPCFLIAPQCPEFRKWAEKNWHGASHTLSENPSAPLNLTLELIGHLARELPIDTKRLYVTGLSMGGFGTWDVLTHRPDLFAAAVPMCGGGDPTAAGRFARLPIWVFHGARDTGNKPELSRTMVAALEKAGGKPKYTEYPNEAHPCWIPAYREPALYQWLFAQHRATEPVLPPTAVEAEMAEGFVSLFNGKDLTGWKLYNSKPEAWMVDNGMMVCTGAGGGWIGTDRDYANFVLRLEYRLPPGGNSGIYIRAPEKGHISRVGMEVQLLDDFHPRFADIEYYQHTGAIYHVFAPTQHASKKAGEWNAIEIRADGREVSVVLNGKRILDANLDRALRDPATAVEHTGLKRTTGRIGLQNHHSRIEFRNLRVKELK